MLRSRQNFVKMVMFKTTRHISYLLAGLFVGSIFSGCASSSGTISPVHPVMTYKPAPFDSIQVATTSDLADLESEKQSFNDHVLSDLRETGIFTNVSELNTNNSAATGIKVESKITEIKKVSEDARLWFGGLAGRARIAVQVTVIDLGSGKQVETFEAIGISGGSARSGTTEEAVERAAEQVAAEVTRINAQAVQLL
jgi:hypothetical protein